ncbi:MAG: 50S ribosomal protein L23 [Planctomycetes bacterium]|nr:50S ribosomal protein L23 [Planctomycetota bacterium]
MVATAEHFAVLKRPLQTEKSVEAQINNVYTFEVDKHSNKKTIKEAVEAIFEVEVKKVRTINQRGERKRRNKNGYFNESDWKKALVTLEKDNAIDIV